MSLRPIAALLTLSLLAGCTDDPSPTVTAASDAGGTTCAANDVERHVDLLWDPQNCGACGNVCRSDQVCAQGRCRCRETAATECAGRCVDLRNDPENCGQCGSDCLPGSVCAGSSCLFLSPAGCGDRRSDNNNCGNCGVRCGAGTSCVDGWCRCNAPGLTLCGDACMDLSSDETNCGSCGVVCTRGASCRGGACVCLRTDLATNEQHCGECGHACSPGQVCRDGACTCPHATERYCGGACVDVRSSLSNCGACGVSCPTSASACVDGACQCPGVRGVLCYGYCQDLDNDVRNCGACGNACASGQQCVSGRCLPAPRSPALGARYATARPTFRWTPSGVTMARVQVCADSRCARVVASFESATTSVTASQDLPAGLLFWRVGDPSIEVYSATRAFAVSRLRGARGGVIGTLHDLTGDGLADLLVGAPGGSLVTLWRGRSGLGPGDPIDVRPPSVMGFGARLAFGGDFDSDGVAEAMVGAYGAPSSYTDHRLRGDGTVARLWDSGLSYANVWAGVGDVNGDGFADFAYGDTGANHVAVRPGSLEGRSTPEMVTYGEVGSEHGAAVSAAWDVDGDGFEDVLVGAPSADASLGRATLYYGATSSLTRTAALTRPPDVTGFGARLTGLGDIDGDGLGDLLVGARTPSWRAFVYRSATLSDLPTPIEGPVGTVARFVAAGDVNGDGYADALLPLPATGRALLYRGGAGGFVEAPEAIVDAAWSRATGAVIGTGDLDGDGFDDIAAGDPSLGVVRVFFGHATRPLTRQVTLTGLSSERFGASLG